MPTRPSAKELIGKNPSDVPMSLQRIAKAAVVGERIWIGPDEAAKLSADEKKEYELAHGIMKHLCVQAPTKHKSGHPGGPLSAFTFAYMTTRRRDPNVDSPMYYSAGHLSLLAYGLQWMFGKGKHDPRLASPQAIIDSFRIPSGLPGHVEAGIGDIPFGTGPLGKGTSVALGRAFGLKLQKKKGVVDVVLADGDSQEGQVMEAMRLASHLQLDNLIVHGDINDIQLSGLPSQTVAADLAAIVAACGWLVIEVQNGNDPAQVKAALDIAEKNVGKGRPIFCCYYTTMGSGIAMMEEGSNTGKENFHGSPLKDEVSAKIVSELPSLEDLVKKYEKFRSTQSPQSNLPLSSLPKVTRTITKEKSSARSDFGAVHIKNLMKADPRIMVLHADLAASGGFDKVAKEFPERVFNVGVAEANMYGMAAGMRQAGLLPITYTFAAFGTNEARANARLIDVNCGHTQCAVLHDCTHAGLSVGEDGETHQERNYLNIPFDHTQVWMPADSNQAGAMAEKALELVVHGTESVFVFSPRSAQPSQLMSPDGSVIYGEDYKYDGKIDLVYGAGNMADQVTILATGQSVHDALAAAKELQDHEDHIHVRVLNVSCIRPIDSAMVIQAALETTHLIVVEDHNSEGGLATQVADIIADFQIPCSLRRLGVNHYFPSGTAEDLKFLAGLDTESIMDAVRDELRVEVHGGEDALVSCVYSFSNHLSFSRFRETAKSFGEKLLNETGYLEALRTFWNKRDVPASKMPKNDVLRSMLGEAMKLAIADGNEE